MIKLIGTDRSKKHFLGKNSLQTFITEFSLCMCWGSWATSRDALGLYLALFSGVAPDSAQRLNMGPGFEPGGTQCSPMQGN